MSTYPAGYDLLPGSIVEQTDQKRVHYAEDGTPRGQIIALAPRYRLFLVHGGLTQTDVDTLRTFYNANLTDVQITWSDGNDYAGALHNWRQTRSGYRWRVTLELYGDRL